MMVILGALVLGLGLAAGVSAQGAENVSSSVLNGDFELGENGEPLTWSHDMWGGTEAKFIYPADGVSDRHDRAAKVVITKEGAGDAKWSMTPISVKPGTTYEYSNFYQSTVSSEVTVQYINGNERAYEWLGDFSETSDYEHLAVQFTPPSGTDAVRVFHLIGEEGSLTIDSVAITSVKEPTLKNCKADVGSFGGLIENGGFENCEGGKPVGWSPDVWGTTEANFIYPAEAVGDGNVGAKVTITEAGTGDAKWSMDLAIVEAGKTYHYTDGYRSTVPSEVVVQYDDNGDLTYEWLGTYEATNGFSNLEVRFTIPSGVERVRVYHLISESGSLTINNANLAPTLGGENETCQSDASDSSNLIFNGDFEDCENGEPSSWSKDVWGGTEANFIYPIEGESGDGAKAIITDAGSGDAKWSMEPVTVEPGATYQYSDAYRSTVSSEITVQFIHASGEKTYQFLGSFAEYPVFKNATRAFTVPSGVRKVRVYHLISEKGELTIDNVKLTKVDDEETVPPPNDDGEDEGNDNDPSRGLVSLDFDDGWTSQYENALPILEEAGIESTFYIITGPVEKHWEDYMTSSQVKELERLGHDVQSHTVTHSNLATLDADEVRFELRHSKQYLEDLLDKDITMLAFPYGSFNNATIEKAKEAGYLGTRTVFVGLNTPSTNPYRLKSYSTEQSTSISKVKNMIDEAIQKDGWLILTFHRVGTNLEGGQKYSVTPGFLQKVVDYIEKTGVETVTDSEGLEMVRG